MNSIYMPKSFYNILNTQYVHNHTTLQPNAQQAQAVCRITESQNP